MSNPQSTINLKEFCKRADQEKYLELGESLVKSNVGKSFSLLSFGLSLNSDKKKAYYKLYLNVVENWSNKLIELSRFQDVLKIFEVAQDIYIESPDLDYLLACTLYRKMAAEMWKVVFRECFGGKGSEYCDELWPLILAVDNGIKPSFLWDVCVPDTSALLSFLHIAYQKGLLEEKLRVVEVGLDVFIVNMTALIRSLTQILTTEDTWLIDISGPEPKIPNKDIHFHFRDHLVSLLTQLGVCDSLNNEDSKIAESLGLQSESSNLVEGCSPSVSGTCNGMATSVEGTCEDKAITINFPEEINLSTVFGCMLGYPQIYWWQGEGGGNSLACVPLKVFKFGAFFNPNSSYVELFSFSIPESLEDQLRPGIERWGNIQNVWVGKSTTFAETKFTCDAVLCLSVAL